MTNQRMETRDVSAVIIKVVEDPTDDTYIMWSIARNRPTHLFRTQQDLRDHVWAEHERQRPIDLDPLYSPDARIERALQAGTSDLLGMYGYAHREWAVPAIGGWATLQRQDLLAFTYDTFAVDGEQRVSASWPR